MIIKILDRVEKGEQNRRIDYAIGCRNGDKLEKVEWLSSNCIISSPIEVINGLKTINESKLTHLKTEMSLDNEFNQRAKKTSDHIVISLQEGETLLNQHWNTIIKRYLTYMGYIDCKWIAIKHNDTECEHAHIVINNLRYDEDKHCYLQVRSNNNRTKSMVVRTQIEKYLQELGLNISSAPTEKNFTEVAITKRRSTLINQLKKELKSIGGNTNSNSSKLKKQEKLTKLQSIEKCDLLYQQNEGKLILIIKEALNFAASEPKQVESFLLYLRSQQVSPLLQFRSTKDKSNVTTKSISGISFLYKGFTYIGSKLGNAVVAGGYKKTFSALSLFTNDILHSSKNKLYFIQGEQKKLKNISDRNYDVKRAIQNLTPKGKRAYKLELHDDEKAILNKISLKEMSPVAVKSNQTKDNVIGIKAKLEKDNTDNKSIHTVTDKAKSNQSSHRAKNHSTTIKNASIDDLNNQEFIIVEISPCLFQALNKLRNAACKYPKSNVYQPNFLLMKRQQKNYFIFKPEWEQTYQYLVEQGVIQNKAVLTDDDLQKVIEIIIALVKAFLAFIRQLFSIPNSESLDTVSNAKIRHIGSVKALNSSQVEGIVDECDDDTKQQLVFLKPELININTVNDKRAMAALFMGLLHRINSGHWLKHYNGKNSDALLKKIGKQAYKICKENADRLGDKTDDESLSKEMRYYLKNNFTLIYEPIFAPKFMQLTNEDIVKAVNLAFEGSDSFENISLKLPQKSNNDERNYTFKGP